MKRLLLVGALLATLIAGTAQSFYTTNSAAATFQVLDAPHRLLSITAVSTNTIIRLYDHPDVGLTNVTSEFVSQISYPTNFVTEYITSTGVTNTFTNTVLWYASITNAAATNPVAPFQVLAASGNVPVTLNLNRSLGRGLVISNNANATVIVQYSTP